MKKNLLKFIFTLFSVCLLITFPSQAISFSELQNDSENYIPFEIGETLNVYLQSNSISIVRYEPPFYILGANVIACDFEQNVILVMPVRFSYDYRRSIEEILKNLSHSADTANVSEERTLDEAIQETIQVLRETLQEEKFKNSGIAFSYYGGDTAYDLDGNFLRKNSTPADKYEPLRYDSLYYSVALTAFYKIYNIRF